MPSTPPETPAGAPDWWRSAVIYQIYPRSFADSNGDGMGDLPGIMHRLPQLVELGIDCVWLSPFFTSPQRDAGYDVSDYCDVDPLFGTLADFDGLVAEAHRLRLRVIVDLVPNHTSSDHPWFTAAVAAGAGSPERARYLFRDGKGPGGNEPPNNWASMFGGPAWTRLTTPDGTPEQWYLHLFDESQPDLDWTNPWVHERFRDILRFWLRRGVDGFRVDVAHGLIKKAGLPDMVIPTAAEVDESAGLMRQPEDVPYWGQPGVHEIYRDWHGVLSEFGDDRILCAEAWVEPLTKLADWVRPDEMQQAFNFRFLEAPWSAVALKAAVVDSLAAFDAVGATTTWVLSNHDVVRHASRLGLVQSPGGGIGPRTEPKPDAALGLRRARAETLFMLALPGSAYLYQGEELGLPEDTELPDSARQDPSFFRHHGTVYGRDGCRVPIPWEADAPAFGFSPTGASWLPQPAAWSRFARDRQEDEPHGTLRMYRDSLALRRRFDLGRGALTWIDGYGPDVLALRNGTVTVLCNVGVDAVPLPAGTVIQASEPLTTSDLPSGTTVWLIEEQ